MKILILNWRGPKHPNAGGAEVATLEHAKYWKSKGHQVTWFTSSYWGCTKPEENIDGIRVIRRSNQVLGVHIAALSWYLFENKEKFDIVIDQFHGIPFFSPIYIRAKKIGYIHEATKDVWKQNQLPKPLNLIPALIGEFSEYLIFNLLYQNIKFMTVSNSTKSDLEEFGIKKEKIRIIHNGLTALKIGRIRKEKTPTLLYLGALAKDKGTDDMLKIFDNLHDKNPDWQYWLAGRSSDNYLDKLKGRNYIKYFGYVSQKKKFELFKKAHIFINPSIREGWGLTNLEANSQGTPVVGYRVPGMIDSVIQNKTGILVPKGDQNLIIKSVIMLFKDKNKYKELSNQSIVWSKRFSWASSGKQSLDYLQEVLGSNF